MTKVHQNLSENMQIYNILHYLLFLQNILCAYSDKDAANIVGEMEHVAKTKKQLRKKRKKLFGVSFMESLRESPPLFLSPADYHASTPKVETIKKAEQFDEYAEYKKQ